MSQQDFANTDISSAQANEIVKLGEAVTRLRNNPDFKLVVGDAYFKQNAIRLVKLKSDPNMQTPERQESIHTEMLGIGCLDSFLDTLLMQADMAEQAIEAAAQEELYDRLQGSAA